MMHAKGTSEKCEPAIILDSLRHQSRRKPRKILHPVIAHEKIRKLGNIRVLHQFKNKKLIVLGPDWFYSVIMGTLISVISLAYLVVALPRLYAWYHRIMGLIIVGCVECSFIACVFKDPGIVRPFPRDTPKELERLPITERTSSSSETTPSEDDSGDEMEVLTGDSSDTTDSEEVDLRPSTDVNDTAWSRQLQSVGIHTMQKPSPVSSDEGQGLYEESTAPPHWFEDDSIYPSSFGHPLEVAADISAGGSPDQPMTLGDRFLQDLQTGRDQQGERHLAQQKRLNDAGERIARGAAHQRFPATRQRGRQPSDSRFCSVCQVTPPLGSYHCEDCQVCIAGYDHHCPWTSKCIGGNNLCEFYTWVFSSITAMIYMGVMTGIALQPGLIAKP